MKRQHYKDGDSIRIQLLDSEFSEWYKGVLKVYPEREYSTSLSIVQEIENLEVRYNIELKLERIKPPAISHEHDKEVFKKLQENPLALNNTSIYNLCDVFHLSKVDTDMAIKNLIHKGLIEINVPTISDYNTIFSVTVSDFGWSTV